MTLIAPLLVEVGPSHDLDNAKGGFDLAVDVEYGLARVLAQCRVAAQPCNRITRQRSSPVPKPNDEPKRTSDASYPIRLIALNLPKDP